MSDAGKWRIFEPRYLGCYDALSSAQKIEMNDTTLSQIHATGEATSFIPAPSAVGSRQEVASRFLRADAFDEAGLDQGPQ